MPIFPAIWPQGYQHEWEEFEVPLLQEPLTMTGEAAPLNELSHTAHVHSALSIVTARIFRPRLIFDESTLNTSRTLVWAVGRVMGRVRP